MVVRAVQMALWQRQENGALILHSDRGGQFVSSDYQTFLGKHALTCSMSAVGHCADNAACEGFSGLLKRERVYRRNYRTRDEARADLFDYLERFHNPVCDVEWRGSISSFQTSSNRPWKRGRTRCRQNYAKALARAVGKRLLYTGGGTRTRTLLKAADFESAASTIPPLRHGRGSIAEARPGLNPGVFAFSKHAARHHARAGAGPGAREGTCTIE